jgi:hypothetical protein
VATARRVRLVYSPQSVPSGQQGFRFTIDVDSANLMAAEIFKMYRRPIDPAAPTVTTDDFISVCTSQELASLPANAPTDDSDGYWRSAHLDQTKDTAELAETARDEIYTDVQALKDDLDAQDNLGTSSATWIGTPP